MIIGWSPFKFVSVSTVLYPRWLPLLKIEISSNGQNCSILSQKVPKFELYKHNDELFNIYYEIFYELLQVDSLFLYSTTLHPHIFMCASITDRTMFTSDTKEFHFHKRDFDWLISKLWIFMKTNVYKQFDPQVMEREERIGINRGLPTMLKLLSQSQPNFAEMILGWSSSKIVSGISEHRPRWPPQPNLI